MTNLPARGSIGLWTVALLLSVLYAGTVLVQWRSARSLPPLVGAIVVAVVAIGEIRDRRAGL